MADSTKLISLNSILNFIRTKLFASADTSYSFGTVMAHGYTGQAQGYVCVDVGLKFPTNKTITVTELKAGMRGPAGGTSAWIIANSTDCLAPNTNYFDKIDVINDGAALRIYFKDINSLPNFVANTAISVVISSLKITISA